MAYFCVFKLFVTRFVIPFYYFYLNNENHDFFMLLNTENKASSMNKL